MGMPVIVGEYRRCISYGPMVRATASVTSAVPVVMVMARFAMVCRDNMQRKQSRREQQGNSQGRYTSPGQDRIAYVSTRHTASWAHTAPVTRW